MKPTSDEKPINVLTRFIAEWIRKDSSEAMPFESFEAMRGRNIVQKDVERWIFNCNYLYFRFGDFLQEHGAIPQKRGDAERMLDYLDEHFKTIADSNPLGLRSKQNAAIACEFLKDWPPFMPKSRNIIDRPDKTKNNRKQGLSQTLGEFVDVFFPNDANRLKELDSFLKQMKEEQKLYAARFGDEQTLCDAPRQTDVLGQCKTLLPLWCAKEVNPLYSLVIWEDEHAIDELCACMQQAFENAGLAAYDGGTKHDSYRGLVKRAQAAYLEGIDDDTDLKHLSVSEINAVLENGFFSLDHPTPAKDIPAWLFGKSQLIWNIVICAIFGPKEALSGALPLRTSTISAQYSAHTGVDPDAMRGEVLLRRVFRNGSIETIDRLILDDVQSSGIWKVIGSNFDENAALPQSKYRNQYRNLGVLFTGSQRFDSAGNITEGRGDSRFHLEISVEVQEDGSKLLVARDLHSKNGTYIVRQDGSETAYLVLNGRQTRGKANWGSRIGVSEKSVTMVGDAVLHRGDIIQLCGSCFEII